MRRKTASTREIHASAHKSLSPVLVCVMTDVGLKRFSKVFKRKTGAIPIGKDNAMAKGQQRGNREAKKPKAEKPKAAAASPLGITPAKPAGGKPAGKK
jgi:hypothetical protein